MTTKELIILGCSSQQPTRTRNHGAYLLRWNEEGLLFDPGEGTQRQFIFVNVAPTCVTRIFVSHFHGDHCLGLGSMLMRLNLDKVTHPIHCYYPRSGKEYFQRLRFGCIYHENIQVVEHPIEASGCVHEDDHFRIEAYFLRHGVDSVGFRVIEKPKRKFLKEKLKEKKVTGLQVRELEEKGVLTIDHQKVHLDEVSFLQEPDIFALVLDTLYCEQAVQTAKNATLFLCESTYGERHKELALKHHHLTARQAAQIAKEAGASNLVLTHFSARYQDLDELLKEARSVFPQCHVAEDFKVFPFSRQPLAD